MENDPAQQGNQEEQENAIASEIEERNQDVGRVKPGPQTGADWYKRSKKLRNLNSQEAVKRQVKREVSQAGKKVAKKATKKVIKKVAVRVGTRIAVATFGWEAMAVVIAVIVIFFIIGVGTYFMLSFIDRTGVGGASFEEAQDLPALIRKTAGTIQIPNGESAVEYTITITNLNDTDMTDIELTDDRADVSGCGLSGKTLAPGESINCTYTSNVSGEDELIYNSAKVSARTDPGDGPENIMQGAGTAVRVGNPGTTMSPCIHPTGGEGWYTWGCQEKHAPDLATDIAVAAGTPIYATNDGIVSLAPSWTEYGNHVTVENSHYKTLYAHMQSYAVKDGEVVTQGQVIGYVNSTGKSDGNHLHYEIERDGVRVCPHPITDGTQPLLDTEGGMSFIDGTVAECLAPSKPVEGDKPFGSGTAGTGPTPWMDTADGELGQKEIPGNGTNERILEYLIASESSADGPIGFDTDDPPNEWCGAFVHWIMERNGYEPKDLPKNTFRAGAWGTWGTQSTQFSKGSIVVLYKNGVPQHVGFANSVGDGYVEVLGGNQDNTVKYKNYLESEWEFKFITPPK